MKQIPQPDRGYMEFGRWFGSVFGLNFGCLCGNVIRNSRHWMYGPEIICMLRGAHTVWVDGVEHRLEAGDVLTIDSFRSHEIYDGTPGGLQMILNFDETLLRRSGDVRLDLSTVGPNALPKDHPDVVALRETVFELCRLCSDPVHTFKAFGAQVTDAEWFEVREYLYKLVKLLSRHQHPANGAMPESPMLLANCIREIHERYQEPLTIANLAEKYGYSSSSLYRLFRQSLGVSFLDYLTSVRLNIACGMLMKNEHTVMEVSDLCGFSSYSNFYRIFKERMGTSPTAYQEGSIPENSQWWTDSDNNPLYQYNQFQAYPVQNTEDWNDLDEMVRKCYK